MFREHQNGSDILLVCDEKTAAAVPLNNLAS